MMERLNNDQITQRIMDTNSDLKQYLNLAPGLKFTSPELKNTCSYETQIPPALIPRLPLRL